MLANGPKCSKIGQNLPFCIVRIYIYIYVLRTLSELYDKTVGGIRQKCPRNTMESVRVYECRRSAMSVLEGYSRQARRL